MLSKLLGATMHAFPEGENEERADQALEEIADGLRVKGKNPYVIHLAKEQPPLGALGYVVAAREILEQISNINLEIDEIIVASGSGATHAGLLFGLRALGVGIQVKGICVRRAKELQRPRILGHCQAIAALLEMPNPVVEKDIEVNDDDLAPGYGKMNEAVLGAIKLTAQSEGIFLDPVYTGRTMAGFLTRAARATKGQNLLFIHTGGQPAIFGYELDLQPISSDKPE